jgi:hypothetical protein
MAGYNEIKGLRVKYLSDDPAGAEDGQVWYNSTTGNLRLQGVGVGAWSSSAPLGTARYAATGFGVQTASVASMGVTVPNTPTTATEEYNGTAWTGTGALPVAADNISGCGTGTQTNVIMAIGRTPATGNSGTNTSVTYNGSVFGSGPNLNTTRMYGSQGGSGTGTAGLIFGGFIDPSPNAMTNTEEYDGSSWTNGGSLNVATGFANGFGTQTNTVTNVNTPANQGSEQYNGTSWSALPNIGVATPGGNYLVATGTSGNAGMISAMNPTLNQVAEWNFTANTIIPGAWASGGALGTARDKAGSFGLQTAAAVVGGETPALTTATEEYNGSSWTAGGAYPTAFAGITALGTQTAGVGFGGYVPPGYTNQTNEYDGSSWTTVNNYPQTSNSSGACGTLTAGLGFGGDNTGVSPRNTTTTAEYDGTNWTAGGALGTGGYLLRGAGIQTAAAAVGGQGRASLTEEYNGSSWTAGGAPLAPVSGNGTTQAGTQDAFIYISTSPSAFTQKYDGTVFSTSPSLATGRNSGSGAGTATAGLYAGGREPAFSTATEEFTGETVSANPASNLSVS